MSSRSTKSRSTTTRIFLMRGSNAGKKWHLRLVGREREKFQEIKNDKGMIGRVTVRVRERNKKVVD